MFCSPTAMPKDAPTPHTKDPMIALITSWQRVLSLLRMVMETPVALIIGTTPLAMPPLVAAQEPWPLPHISLETLTTAAEDTMERVAAIRNRRLIQNDPGTPFEEIIAVKESGLITLLAEPICRPDGSLFATLCVLDTVSHTPVHRAMLTECKYTMENHLALMETRSALSHEIEEREALTQRLTREAVTDPLTGLLNRHSFTERFHQEVTRHERGKRPLSLIICNLDRFQEFNNTQGHSAGDALLVTLATLFKNRLRAHDLIWRWEGDEFLLLLPDTPLMGAVEVVEAVRIMVEERSHRGTPPSQVTLSAGVTSHTPSESKDSCLNRCTQLLKDAKEKGRNCVILG